MLIAEVTDILQLTDGCTSFVVGWRLCRQLCPVAARVQAQRSSAKEPVLSEQGHASKSDVLRQGMC